VREQQADYVLAVKENQPPLYEDVTRLFAPRLLSKASCNRRVTSRTEGVGFLSPPARSPLAVRALCRDLLLATIRRCYQCTSAFQHFQQFRMAVISVDFSSTATLSQGQSQVCAQALTKGMALTPHRRLGAPKRLPSMAT